MTEHLNCGEALARLLEAYGVDTVFGIPGVHTLELYRGLAQTGIRHVQPRHEQGAGFMADGYARASGRPGVCMLITGPGVTNAATALGQAYADSVPVLLVSSVNARESLGKGWGCLHEVSDQRAVTAPLTGLSAVALEAAALPELLGRAFSLFASARPRPAHISVPIDLLAAPADREWRVRPVPARPQADPGAIEEAAARLARAERPVICVGGGAVDAAAEVTALAERLGAAVLASNAGKGVVADSHPLCLGASLVREPVRRYLAGADVVLAVGTELAETDSFVERLPIEGALIRIDIDRDTVAGRYPAEVAIVADAAPALRALLAALDGQSPTARSDAHRAIAATREAALGDLDPVERRHLRLLGALRKALPENTIVVGDTTQLVYSASFGLPVERPRTWIYGAGYCTLGGGLPGAIGAKLGAPERPVAALAGDGGFMFTVQELMTAVELELPLPVVVWNNDGLGQIRDDMRERNIPAIGVDPKNPDFVALARAFGARGVRPESLEAFGQAIGEALAAPVPTLIEVRQDAAWLG